MQTYIKILILTTTMTLYYYYVYYQYSLPIILITTTVLGLQPYRQIPLSRVVKSLPFKRSNELGRDSSLPVAFVLLSKNNFRPFLS